MIQRYENSWLKVTDNLLDNYVSINFELIIIIKGPFWDTNYSCSSRENQILFCQNIKISKIINYLKKTSQIYAQKPLLEDHWKYLSFWKSKRVLWGLFIGFFGLKKRNGTRFLGLKVFGRVVEVGTCISVQTHPRENFLSPEHFRFLRRLKRMECARPQPMSRGIPILVCGWSDSPGAI